jgi:hypothetical protein
MQLMNKLYFLFVTLLGTVVLFVSGCITSGSSSKEEGWIEVSPAETGDSGLINPDDYK